MANKKLLAGLFVVFAGAFWIANRGAYKNYFQADSLDNLSLTRDTSYSQFLRGFVVPEFYPGHFRPTGHLFYKLTWPMFGLWFPPYIAVLQAIHLANVCLLWLILRRLGLPLAAACAGAVFFGFHMAVFAVFWEPMYVFDLLCGTFCLLSLLAYLHERWIIALIAFWIAYRAKELAVTLPLVLLGYELWLGNRRWKRLIPFFAISLWMGVSALLHNTQPNSDWALHFEPASVWRCIVFYSSRFFLVPVAGFGLLVLPLLVRDRRVLWGVAGCCLFLATLLLLPGRLFSPYLYVPLIGAAVAIGASFERAPRFVVAGFLMVWLPWNYVNLRWLRKAELARGDAARIYSGSVIKAVVTHPEVTAFAYNEAPLESWGVSGLIRLLHPPLTAIHLVQEDEPSSYRVLHTAPVMLLNWHPIYGLAPLVHAEPGPTASYLDLDWRTPVWHLQEGWYGNNGTFRWIQPAASAVLLRPDGANCFAVKVNIGSELIEHVKRTRLRVLIDAAEVGTSEFDHKGLQTVSWPVASRAAGPAEIRFEVAPAYRTAQGNLLGVAIAGFGFFTK